MMAPAASCSYVCMCIGWEFASFCVLAMSAAWCLDRCLCLYLIALDLCSHVHVYLTLQAELGSSFHLDLTLRHYTLVRWYFVRRSVERPASRRVALDTGERHRFPESRWIRGPDTAGIAHSANA